MTDRTPEIVADADQKPVSRRDRRRNDTRDRLLKAALEVMARKGPEATTVQEITDAADVGFGSFYNHFRSKEEIHAAVMEGLLDHFGDAVDRRIAALADPAEMVAAGIRLTYRQLAAEPSWADFILHQPISADMLEHELGRRLSRDLRHGAESGRFTALDGDAAILAACGAAIGLLAAMRGGRLEAAAPEHVARTMLRLIGLSEADASDIVARPLPPQPTD